MKYIVEVGEPVPSNLDEIAGKVAASFNINEAKAMALLRRAPGAMTKAVSEREADVVAGIFERAGLNVVKRPVAEESGAAAPAGGEEPGREPAAGGAATAGSDTQSMPAGAPPPVEGSEGGALDAELGFGASSGAGAEAAEPAPPPGGDDDVWNRPLGSTEGEPVDSFSRRDAFEEQAPEVGWEGEPWGASTAGGEGEDGAALVPQEPEPAAAGLAAADDDEDIDVEVGTPAQERPAPGGAAAADPAAAPAAEVEQPAAAPGRRKADRRRRQRRGKAEPAAAPRGRDAAGRSAERGGDEVRPSRGGVRRGIAWVGVLPPLLSLLAMGAAMLVTLVPVARDQQATQAADAAASQAAALQALTGGLPLSAQTLSGALTDLSNNAQALLVPHGVSLLVVTDANGDPLAGWYGPAKTPAAMPPATRQAVSASALTAVSGGSQAPATTFTQSLKDTWRSVGAMLGRGTEAPVLRAAPVVSAGQPIGSVVVGVPPVSARGGLTAAFETVLLVGLIPLLIGILMAMGVTGGMRRKVRYLLQAADRISRGDLDEPVSLRSRDDLGQLARAIERMRVSLAALLEHRRRNR